LADSIFLRFSFLILRFFFGVFKYAGEGQGSRATASTLQAADAAKVIWAFFRLYVIFAELMALEAFGAFIGIEPYEESRGAIEQRKYHSERAQYPAPRPSCKENCHEKQDKDCQFKRVRPDKLPACKGLLNHIRDGLFERNGLISEPFMEQLRTIGKALGHH
jgi:hypothetical protein